MIENALSHLLSRRRIVPGDERANLTKVRDRLLGPDYLEVHELAQDSNNCSASSCVLIRSAATSDRPRRIAAIICNSSVISSREAFSGSLCKASITACLSVMASRLHLTDFLRKLSIDSDSHFGGRRCSLFVCSPAFRRFFGRWDGRTPKGGTTYAKMID
jgi:hypothetical protein